MSPRLRPVLLHLGLGLGALLVLAAAGGGGLASPPLDRPGEWPAWAAEREPALAVVAVVRLVGLTVAGYLVAVTTAVLVATVRPSAFLVRLARALALPALRPVLAAGLTAVPPITDVTTTLLAPLVAVEPPPSAGATMRLLDDEPRPPPAPAPPAPAPAATHTIAPGEHLWAVAEQALARAWGRPPTDAEIVPYWRAVIEENRHRLADADNPDLVFPGQVMTVPPAPPRSAATR